MKKKCFYMQSVVAVQGIYTYIYLSTLPDPKVTGYLGVRPIKMLLLVNCPFSGGA